MNGSEFICGVAIGITVTIALIIIMAAWIGHRGE